MTDHLEGDPWRITSQLYARDVSELTHTVLVKLDTQGEIVYIDPQDMKSSGICLLVNGGFPPNLSEASQWIKKVYRLTKITSQIPKNLAEGSSSQHNCIATGALILTEK